MKTGLLGIIKLIAALCLIPVVIGITIGFSDEIGMLKRFADFFWYGVLAYVLFHLFIFTPQGLYHFFQGILKEVFGFSSILSSILPDVIPFLTTGVLLVFYVVVNLMNIKGWEPVILFVTGFSVSMHIVLTAQDEYEEDETQLKGHYVFHAVLMYSVVLALVMILLHVCFETVSFLNFWNASYDAVMKVYDFILHRLHLI